MTTRSRSSAPLAVVTGATSGFGAAIVSALHQGGWQVIAGARRGSSRGQDSSAIRWFELDICRATDRDALVQHIHDKHGGRLDLLVNNAGSALFGALEDTSEAELRAQFEVNLFAPTLLSRALLPALRASQGRIITISSALARWPMPFGASYCASKAAIDALSEALHFEAAPLGVQIALVEPGAHRTALLDNAAWALPGDVYRRATARHRSFRNDRGQREDLPGPEAVGRAVATLAARPRMPLRALVGRDAYLLALLRGVLPPRWLWALKRRVFRPWFDDQPTSRGL